MKKLWQKENILLFIPLLVIIIGSFLIMYQTRFISSIYQNHLFKQILWILIGLGIIFLLQKVKIRFILNNSFYFYLLTIILLILVLFFGKEINGAKAWFNLRFFNLQPSEIAKVGILLYLSKIGEDFHNHHLSELTYLFKSLLIVLIPSFLVFLEPDTGAIIMYFALLLGVLLFSGIKKRWFIIGFILLSTIIVSFIYLYFAKQDFLIDLIGTGLIYRIERILSFKNGSSMQLNNALITIGNAGLLGHGILKDILYVPEFPTDFAFTLGVSIWGFLGTILILFSYFLINLFFIKKLFKVKEKISKTFISAFLVMFIWQQIENIGMNLGLLPIMGIPLPFLSYGGSNLITYFIFLGIILILN